MEVFVWEKSFETGLTEVDRQHRYLVELSNQFGKQLSEDNVSHAAMEQLFRELADYTQYHFDEEEKEMAHSRVDPRHVEYHEEIHNGFLADLMEMYEEETLVQRESATHLFDFLLNWLVYHILGCDMQMARQIEAIKGGKSPAQAYEESIQYEDRSTELLLKSLNNLFRQVSGRSKELKELNASLEAQVAQRTQELLEANETLTYLASTDVLTGLANRRRAMQVLDELWHQSEQDGSALAVLMLDADGFKQINDEYGHDAGDEVLRELAKELEHGVRTDDIVCRMGGDEFLVICPDTQVQGALHLGQKLHALIAGLRIRAGEGIWHGSVSMGVASSAPAQGKGIDALIKSADEG
ncbi:MAG: diguanylate cyclase, partial [Geobacteraceae bacterium]|nr:diguanylate cyclase [Geobacteraceae bacterium]